PRIADPTRQGIEPLHLDFGRSSCDCSIWAYNVECPVSAVGCPIEHVAEADHPAAGKLIIAPDLAAADKGGVTSTPIECATKRTLQRDAAPCPANVGADVA